MSEKTKPRLRDSYENEARPALLEKFGYGSAMQIPKPVKVVLKEQTNVSIMCH